MKRFIRALTLLSALLFFKGCENYHETAGDFAGMWQMTQWRDNATGDILPTSADGIYFCVQRQLMKFQCQSDLKRYYLTTYTRTHESIQLGVILEYPVDTIVTDYTLLNANYAVPVDGKFQIDLLDRNHLILSTDAATLTFRKY